MKKNALVFIFLSIFYIQSSWAQTEIGIIVSPSLSVNRVTTTNDLYDITSGAAKLKISFGAFADFFLKENYYFSSGLIYAPKNVTIRYTPDDVTGQIRESFSVQYLQIPATLKLYTNELALDRRIFVQLGLLNEIKINQKSDTEINNAIRKFKLVDFSVLFRGGLDFRVGYNTSLFAGISYTRGLANVLGTYNFPNEQVKIKNDLISIDFGVRF